MMKKNGFTLAEVLITLAIIGVVATLTLPALMTNTAEQQSITAFKKLINTLTEAGQMNAAMNGFDFSISTTGTKGDSADSGTISMWALFDDRLQVNEKTSGVGFTNHAKEADDMCKGTNTIVLRDNTAICLQGMKTDSNANNDVYWNIYVDTNGMKGPNQKSYCAEEGCKDKAKRAIKDQFPVTLYKGMAFPGHWDAIYSESATSDVNGAYAARYAMGVATQNKS